MKTLIAQDVDGVLIPWDDEAYEVIDSPTRSVYDRFGKKTGFKDWKWNTDRDVRYLTFWSPEQHRLIQEVGDVMWLTTWAKEVRREAPLHNEYTRLTGFGPFDRIAPSQNNYEAEYLYRWWKMGWFYGWVQENHQRAAQYDRVLWVDDDHNRPGTIEGLEDLAYQFAKLGTDLIVVQPRGPVWSREEISLWLTNP